MKKNKKNKQGKAIFVILFVICALVFGISAYKLWSYYSENSAAEMEFEQLLPEDIRDADATETGDEKSEYDYMLQFYTRLRSENEDMVGWLRIPGTRISYPVMHTPDDPEFYLRKNFAKEFSMNGTLFVNAICNAELPTDVVTVYGHRMRSLAMFGTLGDFLDPDFFAGHQKVIFDTFVRRNEYHIYGLFSLDVSIPGGFDYYNYSQFVNENEFDYFLNEVQSLLEIQNSDYTPVYGDKLLLLSTCEYTHNDGRLVIVAVRD